MFNKYKSVLLRKDLKFSQEIHFKSRILVLNKRAENL